MSEERTGPQAGEHWREVWDAFSDAYFDYAKRNPNWQAFFSEHHMYALDEALRVYDQLKGGSCVSEHEFTPEQIVDGIESALRDGPVSVVPSLIRLLAAQDPRRAEAVYETIRTGLRIAEERE